MSPYTRSKFPGAVDRSGYQLSRWMIAEQGDVVMACISLWTLGDIYLHRPGCTESSSKILFARLADFLLDHLKKQFDRHPWGQKGLERLAGGLLLVRPR
eukprot:scaffold11323_cov69-Skeletonema_dohrnii-CCMP3373.AAC.2